MVDEAEDKERWKSENKRDEREFFQGGVRKEIDFYPVRKIVKKTAKYRRTDSSIS